MTPPLSALVTGLVAHSQLGRGLCLCRQYHHSARSQLDQCHGQSSRWILHHSSPELFCHAGSSPRSLTPCDDTHQFRDTTTTRWPGIRMSLFIGCVDSSCIRHCSCALDCLHCRKVCPGSISSGTSACLSWWHVTHLIVQGLIDHIHVLGVQS